jgi:hypothetical protein
MSLLNDALSDKFAQQRDDFSRSQANREFVARALLDKVSDPDVTPAEQTHAYGEIARLVGGGKKAPNKPAAPLDMIVGHIFHQDHAGDSAPQGGASVSSPAATAQLPIEPRVVPQALGLPSAASEPSPSSVPQRVLESSVPVTDALPPPGPSPSTVPQRPPVGVDLRTDQATRSRIADPLDYSVKRYEQMLVSPRPADANGRLASAGVGARRGAADGFRRGGVIGAIVGAVGGGVHGAIDPSLDERQGQQREIAREGNTLSNVAGAEGTRLKLKDIASQVRQRNAQTNYLNARPGIEEDKIGAKARKDEQQAVVRNLSLLKGQPLDPSNPEHAAFLERAKRAGVFVDPAAWNNAKGNLATVTLTYPDDPTKTQTVLLNKLTGEQTVVGQKGFQQTVNPDTGLTPNQEGLKKDREDFHADLQAQRGIANEFSRYRLKQGDQRIRQGDQRLTLLQAAQDHTFSQDARKELGAAETLRAESERFEQLANDADGRVHYFDPDTKEWKESKKWAEKRDEFRARAGSLRSQLYGSYGYLWSPDGQGSPQMTYDEFTRNHPALLAGGYREGNKVIPTTKDDILAAAQRLGVQITDGDQPVTAPRAPGSAIPRRAAPTRTSTVPQKPQAAPTGAKFTEADVRARAAKAGKDPDVAVALARKNHLIP